MGGYGREVLFPFSDLDLLFLFANEKIEEESRPLIAEFSRTLWDLGFRVSSAGRTIDECKKIEQDNAEFHLAMLDRRYLDGDKALFEKLDTKILSVAEKQARPFLLVELQRLTRDRLGRYGNTIFHLEPNVKDAPGGLRDFHSTLWMRQLAGDRRDPRFSPVNEDELTRNAVEFLSAIRCFLHYSNGRNDNTLTYELQAQAAERSLGIDDNLRRNAAEWMRLYFRHARTLNRQLLRYVDQRPPVTLSLRRRLMNAAIGPKTEVPSGRPFAVRDGLLEITNEHLFADRNVTYSLLTEAARSGVTLSRDAERSIAYIMAHPELTAAKLADHLAGTVGNSGRRLSGSGVAADAPPRVADGSAAGIPRDRFAGGARFLSSLHGGRTFVAHDRTPAGTGRSAGTAGETLRAAVANGGPARPADPVFAAA